MSAARESDFISEARANVRKIWDAYNALKALQIEWNALDYGNTLDNGSGANEGITKTMVGSAVFDTTDEIKLRIFDTGHATNLANLL